MLSNKIASIPHHVHLSFYHDSGCAKQIKALLPAKTGCVWGIKTKSSMQKKRQEYLSAVMFRNSGYTTILIKNAVTGVK